MTTSADETDEDADHDEADERKSALARGDPR